PTPSTCQRVAGVGATSGAKPRSACTPNTPSPSASQPAFAGASLRSSPSHPGCTPVGRTSKSVRSRHRDMARTDLEIRPTAWWPLVLTLAALLCTPLTAGADEGDYYRIVSIDTPQAQTESR